METLSFDDPTLANALFGPHNAHLNVIAERTGADLSTRGTTLAVTSDDPALRERILNLFTQFYGLLRSGHALQSSDLEQGLQLLESDPRRACHRCHPWRRHQGCGCPRNHTCPKA